MSAPNPSGHLLRHFHLDINPVPWKAPTAFVKRFGGKYTAAVAPSVELATYQAALRELLYEQWGDSAPWSGPVELRWWFSRKIVSYKNAEGRTVTKNRCDVSNCVKAAEDALQAHKKSGWQGVIVNDIQVKRFSAEMVRQGKDVDRPCVIVEVWALNDD